MTSKLTVLAAGLAGLCLVPSSSAAQDGDAAAGGEIDYNFPAFPADEVQPDATEPVEPPRYSVEATTGIRYQSDSSVLFGRYRGTPDDGPTAIGGFEARGRADWRSDDTEYWEAIGTDLGLPSRSFTGRYGYQGSWGVEFHYDGQPFHWSDSFKTIYDTSGNGTLVANPGTTSTATATFNAGSGAQLTTQSNAWANSAQLEPFLETRDIETQRDLFEGGLTYHIDNRWTFRASASHEHKEGTVASSLLFGQGFGITVRQGNALFSPTGASANALGFNCGICQLVYYAQPVDYDTQRYEASLTFNSPKLQAQLAYVFSKFSNADTSFDALDPFTGLSGSNLPNNIPGGGAIRAAYSLPPSNMEHQVKAAIGYNFTPTTRLAADLSYSLALQDGDQVPATNNPASLYTPSVAAALQNNDDFEGRLLNLFGNVVLTAMPLPKLNVRASYTIDDREDQSSVLTPFRVVGDGIGAPGRGFSPGPTSGDTHPRSFQSQRVKLTAGYRILPGTRVSADYTFTQKSGDYFLSEGTQEHAATGRIRSSFGDWISGSLAYTHAIREPFGPLDPHPLGDNPYGIVPYFQSERTRNQLTAHLDFMVTPEVTVSLHGKATLDDYDLPIAPDDTNPVLTRGAGRRENTSLQIGPDLNYVSRDGTLSAYLTYSFERDFYQSHHTTTLADDTAGNAVVRAAGNDPHYSYRDTQVTHTAGAGAEWQVTDSLRLGLTYSYQNGNLSLETEGGVNPAYIAATADTVGAVNLQNFRLLPLPDVTSELHSVSLTAEYSFTPKISLLAGYAFEHFNFQDYGFDYRAINETTGNALLSGDDDLSYGVHVIGAAVRVKL